MPLESALMAVLNSTQEELYGLVIGFEPDQVKDLNLYQLRVLYAGQRVGITSEVLRSHSWFDNEMAAEALKFYLSHNIPAAHALAQIKALVEKITQEDKSDFSFCFNDLQRKCIKELVQKQRLTPQQGQVILDPIEKLYYCQKEAYRKTISKGVRPEDFENRPWFDTEAHVYAFEYLIMERCLSIQEAFDEIHAMSWQQADLIKDGFSRADIIHLNSFQLKSLQKYYEKGLSVELLKSFPHFNSIWHSNGLDDLIKGNMEPNEALIKLYDCDFTQVRDSRSLDEAINPNKKTTPKQTLNKYQRDSLWLRYKGLREQDFYYRPWFDSIHHERALSLLIEKGYSVKDALEEIDLFNWQQASLISCGFKRQDIVVLNRYQIHSLRSYYKQGLNLELLKNSRQFNNI